MSELKPCPFCGAIPKTETSYISCGGGLTMRATVYCSVCGCSKTVKFDGLEKPFDVYKGAFIGAIEEWNRRAE